MTIPAAAVRNMTHTTQKPRRKSEGRRLRTVGLLRRAVVRRRVGVERLRPDPLRSAWLRRVVDRVAGLLDLAAGFAGFTAGFAGSRVCFFGGVRFVSVGCFFIGSTPSIIRLLPASSSPGELFTTRMGDNAVLPLGQATGPRLCWG